MLASLFKTSCALAASLIQITSSSKSSMSFHCLPIIYHCLSMLSTIFLLIINIIFLTPAKECALIAPRR
nr:MAG TPA: hypothetical protein [Bacteriophage sp.]